MTSASPSPKDGEGASPRVFPMPGTTLYRMIWEPGFKATFHSRLKQSNRFMAGLYKLGVLPLLGMKGIMLLTTRGRKSGELRENPIGYFEIDGVVHIFSAWGRDANWYKNMMACPDDVTIQIGRRRSRVRPEVVQDGLEVERTLEKLVQQNPDGARTLMGWDAGRDQLATADFSTMVEKVLVVRFHER